MAKAKGNIKRETVAKRTSIGNSTNSRPKNKHKRKKSYRGQGR